MNGQNEQYFSSWILQSLFHKRLRLFAEHIKLDFLCQLSVLNFMKDFIDFSN